MTLKVPASVPSVLENVPLMLLPDTVPESVAPLLALVGAVTVPEKAPPVVTDPVRFCVWGDCPGLVIVVVPVKVPFVPSLVI